MNVFHRFLIESVIFLRIAQILDDFDGKASAAIALACTHDNNPDALIWLRLASEQGDSVSQVTLGRMYKNGIGVEQNISRAIKWFRRSADQGNCVGQHELGLAYWYGVGVQQDFTRALKWIRLAADQGDTKAQLAMGSAYMGGHGGLSIDKHEAFLWYLRAATLGDPSGQYNTGLRYFAGDGVTQDADAAEKWFELAANQGHSKALKHLAQARMMKR